MLLWILQGLEIGIVALASLGDYVWKHRLRRPSS
jgi:hypothetical protein